MRPGSSRLATRVQHAVNPPPSIDGKFFSLLYFRILNWRDTCARMGGINTPFKTS